jgi:chromosome segregation protein
VLLKTLSLAGFKSFADRTRLEFDRGVNVVVGPNGSGKSNLLDALAWVMGTQATSTLRTERMADVIFAGTATRPSLSRSEVSLTFDNADGFLPIDLAEITMTRRLYRDGTSEYELNGAPCRLMDIHELLSDGGVGRHQHVLVSQGQIGEILNARPDEHRLVIEEAAGITKHRSRRDRSIRRLEATDLDVARLNDLLSEHRRRVRPLKRQAEAAQRHQSLKAELKALRLWLGGDELRSLRSRLEAASSEQATLGAALGRDEAERAELRTNLSELQAAAGEVGRALESDTVAAARLETVAERFHRIDLVARERRFSLESRLRGAGERRADLEAERVDVIAELENIDDQSRAASSLAERREATLRALEDEERALAEQIQLPAEGLVANLRGDLRALETAEDRDRREGEAVAKRREVVEAQLAEETREVEELNTEIRATDAGISPAQAAYESAETARRSAQDSFEAAETALQDARIAATGAQARVEAIEAALDGLGDPAALERAAAAPGVRGSVVSLLDVPEHVAGAIDAALGSWRAALAAEPTVLGDLVADLKSHGLGGVGFVAGAWTDEEARLADTRAAAAGFGADALVDLLGPGADRSLAASLLGDVVMVEGWAAGWKLAQRHPRLRAVTPEGDVIAAHGMLLGNADGAGPAALEAATVALEIADRDLARAESQYATTRRTFDLARDEERTALELLETLETKLAGHSEALGLVERSRAEHRAELQRLDDRAAGLAEAAAGRSERITELRARIADLEGEEAAMQEAWDALNRRREHVATRRDEARRLREDAAAAVAGAAERRRLLEARLTATTAELESFDDAAIDPAAIDDLSSLEHVAKRALAAVRVHVDTLRERQRELRERAGAADSRLDAAHSREQELETAISAAKERLSALAVELAEVRVRLEAVAEGLRRDADASEDEALAAPRPDLPEDADAHRLLESLEAELRRMGPINPLAAAEYAELSAQVELLEGQLADLEESRNELRKVIAALDDEMAAMFLTAFEEIASLYEENFALVFPGGRGRLRLTDPGRPLLTGVEIDAQPLGKKVGRLSLLSGGERSLAALAFLFAVFRARPSPFYVLDEVEAALDDANLRRFIRLVETLRESAQLVIITHQQQTMEAGDILYGVTMEPGASSQVIAKRLHEVRT